MKKNIKGLLIYPPVQLMEEERPRPGGSLGLPYLASALEQKGIETDVLDASIGAKKHNLKDTFYKYVKQENNLVRIGMSFEEIANYVVNKRYDFVGINSNLTPQTKMAFETAKAIRQSNPQIKIYAGGVNARALKERFLETNNFDAICLTEGEIIFPRAIMESVENVPGFAYVDKNGKLRINPVDKTCFPEHLDDLLMPSWEKLPLDKYEEISSPHGVDVSGKSNYRYAPIMTSRGCVWHCSYCHISTEKKDIGRLRTHSIERVINEMDKLKSLKIEKLFFADDTPFAKKKRMSYILEGIKEMGLTFLLANGANIRDYYLNHSDKKAFSIDKGFLESLASSGFEQIIFPVESGSQRILNKYASGKVRLDRMNLPLLMRKMIEIGIKSPVNLMIGFPDETEEEMFKTIELGKKLKDVGSPYISFFIPTPFPGSRLYETAINGGHLNEDFNPDHMNFKIPIMNNTTISPERLEEIRDQANLDVNDADFIAHAIEQTIGYKMKKR